MEVILLERVEKLGQMGDVVKVRPGFARNYLLPQGKALRATRSNKDVFEKRRAQLEAENLQRRQEAEAVAEKMEGLSVVLIRSASEMGQLYGSVSTRDIANAVTEAGFTITRNQVQLDRPIKILGLHPIRVRLHPEVTLDVVVNVAKSQEEAEAQARGEDPKDEAHEEAEAHFDAAPEEGDSEDHTAEDEAAAPAEETAPASA